MSAWPPIAGLVPHVAPMLALEELVDWSPGHAVARMCVRAESPFVRDGRLSVLCTLEFMAQGVAACLGYEARNAGEGVRVGVVIACRSMDIVRPSVPVGTELTIRVRRLRGTDAVSLFDTRAEAADGVLAHAVLTLFHGARPQEAQPRRGAPTSR